MSTSPKPAPASAENGTESKHKRQILSEVLELCIPPARCGTHLKAAIDDPDLNEKIAAAKQALKDAIAAKDAAAVKNAKDAKDELEKKSIRISRQNPVVIAALCELVARDLLTHAFTQTLATDRKSVEVAAIFEGPFDKTAAFAFVRSLPEFEGYNPEHEDELRKRRTEANRAAKAAREAAREAKKKGEGAPIVAAVAAAAAVAATATDADLDDILGSDPFAEEEQEQEQERGAGGVPATTFFTYVENIVRALREEEKHKGVTRVSGRIREFVSDLIAQLIVRIGVLSKVAVQEFVHVRTLTDRHTLAVIRMIMFIQGVSEADIKRYTDSVEAKLELFKHHIDEEKVRKDTEMPAEKKAELQKKKDEMEIERKRKALDSAKRQAVKFAEKAKSLNAEVGPAKTAAAAAAAKK